MGNLKKRKRPQWTCIAEREFDGDIVITDPCYIRETGQRIDWDSHESLMKELGLFNTTYYGDWGCTVYETKKDKVGLMYDDIYAIGEFCADAGLVCVLDMRDALRISPGFDKWIIDHDWCATIIKSFRGRVRLMTLKKKAWLMVDGKRHYYNNIELRVRGDGMKDGEPFCFESYQTSL